MIRDIGGFTKAIGTSRKDAGTWLAEHHGELCPICKKFEMWYPFTHVDHIVPVSQAIAAHNFDLLRELSRLTNLRIVCARCNLVKNG
jgi:hypothetical protein